jgi:hypothetical protein
VNTRQTLHLIGQSVTRAPRTFALSVFGIAVGISVLAFFLALSQGMQKRVLGRIFPADRLEVVPAKSSLDQSALGALDSLLGGPKLLSDELVTELRGRPEVAAVFPRMRLAFPVRGWGGESILGRTVYTELIIDGIDAQAVTEPTGPVRFADHVSAQNPFCTEDQNCPQGTYCSWDVNKCEPPVPVIVSPMLLELYNGSIAKTHGLPRISGMLAGRMRGLMLTAELGRSFVSKRAVGTPKQRRMMLVGISDRAQPLGMTVPLAYVQRWNAEYAGERAAKEYSSVSVQLKPGRSVTAIVEYVRKLGYTIEDNGAEQAGLAVTLITALFVLVSLSTLIVAAVNVAHTFFRAIAERRHELGVMRAVGATERDVSALLLGEAAAVGLLGGLTGLGLARLFGALIDLLSRKVLPEFPFKPASYFWFSPELLLLLLGFSVLVCLVGAAWPARAAAKLSPAEALSGRPG